MKLTATSAALGCLALLGCTQQASDARPDSTESLKSADASFQKAVAAKDLNKIVSFYADTAVLMPTAEPIISGKAAIAKEWEHILAIPAFENTSKLTGVETSASNDLGYTMGTYTSQLMGEDGKLVAEPGKGFRFGRSRLTDLGRLLSTPTTRTSSHPTISDFSVMSAWVDTVEKVRPPRIQTFLSKFSAFAAKLSH